MVTKSTPADLELDRLNKISEDASKAGLSPADAIRADTASITHAREQAHQEHRHDRPASGAHNTRHRVAHLRKVQSHTTRTEASATLEVRAEYTFPVKNTNDAVRLIGHFDKQGNFTAQAYDISPNDPNPRPRELDANQKNLLAEITREDAKLYSEGLKITKDTGPLFISKPLSAHNQSRFNNLPIVMAGKMKFYMDNYPGEFVKRFQNDIPAAREYLKDPDNRRDAIAHMKDHPDDVLSQAIKKEKLLDEGNQASTTPQRNTPKFGQ